MGAKLQKKYSDNSMGLFRSRDKSKDRSRPLSEAPSAATTQDSNPASDNSLQNSINASTAPTSISNLSNNPNSSSTISTAPSKINDQPAGTVVTTTTTTTTTTTIVRADGTTAVSTQQYNPGTDPPPNTNVVQRPDAATIQSPTQSSLGGIKSPGPNVASIPSPIPESPALTQGLARQHTGGNRTIPPRSELRNSRGTSPNAQSHSTFQPNTQRNSGEYVSPISATQAPPHFPPPPPQPTVQAPTAPPAHIPSQPIELSTSPPVHSQSQSQYFTNTPASSAVKPSSSSTPALNFSRPSAPTPNTASTHNATTTSQPAETSATAATVNSPLTSHPTSVPSAAHAAAPIPATKTKQSPSFSQTLKGLHGAGEALRGSINSKVAQATHDTTELERQRLIREQGMREYQASGLHLESKVGHGREGGFRERAEQRLRRKSVGAANGGNVVYGSAGPEGLRPLGEVHNE